MDTRGLASFFCEISSLRINQNGTTAHRLGHGTHHRQRVGERQHTRGRRAAACAAGAALAGLSAARGAGGGAGSGGARHRQ